MPVTDIGIDLGTSTIIVYVKGKGILYQEPSVVAYDRDSDKILAFGTEAWHIIGRATGNIVGIRPLKDGVISDFVITERMLQYFIRKSLGLRNFLKPRICICVPDGVTDIEKRAVEEAAYRAGARDVVIVREPILAAMGAGLDITRPSGNMVVNIGGDITEIAVLSLGGIVSAQTMKVAGSTFSEAIRRYVRNTYDMIITEQAAEEVKLSLYSVSSDPGVHEVKVNGRDSVTGNPGSISLTESQVASAVSRPVHQIVDAVHGVIERTQPDLANDIAERGIILVGGGAMLRGIEDAMTKTMGIRTLLADNPQQAVALGTGLYIRTMAEFEKRRF